MLNIVEIGLSIQAASLDSDNLFSQQYYCER